MPPHPAPGPMVSAPLQRTALNRQHARRAGQPFTQRLGSGSAAQPELSFSARSPQGHPTPSSHASSPTALSTQSPASMHQGGMTPPASSVMHGQQQQQHFGVQQQQQQARQRYVMQHPPQRAAPPVQYSSSGNVSSLSAPSLGDGNNGVASAPSTYYPSPFQKHIEELGKFSHSPNPSLPNRTMFVLG